MTLDEPQATARLAGALEALIAELVAREVERRLCGPHWLTIEEAAVRYRTTPAALRKRALRGTLPGAARDGIRWLVNVTEYDSALQGSRLREVRHGARAA